MLTANVNLCWSWLNVTKAMVGSDMNSFYFPYIKEYMQTIRKICCAIFDVQALHSPCKVNIFVLQSVRQCHTMQAQDTMYVNIFCVTKMLSYTFLWIFVRWLHQYPPDVYCYIHREHIYSKLLQKSFLLTYLPLEKWPQFHRRHFRRIFVNEKCCILMRISLKFVSKVPIDNNPALV